MKTALITGANRGIGFETARQIAQAGVRVILSGRDADKVNEATRILRAEGLNVEALTLDVTNADHIEAVTDWIDRLDILVNNAAVKIEGNGLEAWAKTFHTNVYGLIAVTNAFLPLLKRSSAGRIVNVSSIIGSILPQSKRPPDAPAYNASKLAVNMWTLHLAHELRGTKIKVNAAHPGHADTKMGGRGYINGVLRATDAAKTSVALALLLDDGPTGAFMHRGEHVAW